MNESNDSKKKGGKNKRKSFLPSRSSLRNVTTASLSYQSMFSYLPQKQIQVLGVAGVSKREPTTDFRDEAIPACLF